MMIDLITYHQKKSQQLLGFVPNFTIQEAVIDIKRAFEKKCLKIHFLMKCISI